MKLIMENWNKFLKENETPAGPWLENLKQVAMDYLIANPGVEIADVPIKDIFAHADIDPDMDDEFVRSNLDPEQKSWWLLDADSIRDAIAEALDAELGPVQDPDTTGNWRGNENPMRE